MAGITYEITKQRLGNTNTPFLRNKPCGVASRQTVWGRYDANTSAESQGVANSEATRSKMLSEHWSAIIRSVEVSTPQTFPSLTTGRHEI